MQRRNASRSAVPRVTGNPPRADSSQPNARLSPQRVLAHVPQPAARDATRDRRVDVRAVDRREHERTGAGNVLAPVDRHARVEPRDRGRDRTRDLVGEPARRTRRRRGATRRDSCRAAPTIWSTTSSMLMSLVSTTIAPSASRSGLSARVESRRSRSMIADSTSWRSPPISPTRRSARTRGDAVTYSFNRASGNTTDAMSRPSTTPPPRARTHVPLTFDELGAHPAVGGHDADRLR